MFCNPAFIPVMHTGTTTSGKFGAHNAIDPTSPVSVTLSTCHFPPRLHLLEGHITGSHALKSILHSCGSIKSLHSASDFITFSFVTVYSPKPLQLTLFPTNGLENILAGIKLDSNFLFSLFKQLSALLKSFANFSSFPSLLCLNENNNELSSSPTSVPPPKSSLGMPLRYTVFLFIFPLDEYSNSI